MAPDTDTLEMMQRLDEATHFNCIRDIENVMISIQMQIVRQPALSLNLDHKLQQATDRQHALTRAYTGAAPVGPGADSTQNCWSGS